ncbi:hypothetical protein K2173_027477 [Erythroxylum novogranatense]|uniref:SAP domain-containing protein n=1 Tax=Erythroxylum novogranatense TaxID=1862640 RepID=A0AAV8TZB3_9ROSI|nr:hypothetical protein K2173_027477 [Erythroxylum novogranatense]
MEDSSSHPFDSNLTATGASNSSPIFLLAASYPPPSSPLIRNLLLFAVSVFDLEICGNEVVVVYPVFNLGTGVFFNVRLGGMRVYICDRDTSPPEGQLIKTNQTNILIRSLQLKKQKGESSSKDVKGAHATDGSRKRAPERVLDSRASAKRNNSQPGPRQEGSASRTSERDLQCLTVERLRALLRAQGLSTKGKKDELVARLKSVNG